MDLFKQIRGYRDWYPPTMSGEWNNKANQTLYELIKALRNQDRDINDISVKMDQQARVSLL